MPGVGAAAAPLGQMSVKYLAVGVGVDSFLRQFLDILKVTSHSYLELLLPVSDVDFACHLASDLVDDDRNSAYASVLTLARSSAASTAAFPHLEVYAYLYVRRIKGF
jgi:hypothetical protein